MSFLLFYSMHHYADALNHSVSCSSHSFHLWFVSSSKPPKGRVLSLSVPRGFSVSSLMRWCGTLNWFNVTSRVLYRDTAGSYSVPKTNMNMNLCRQSSVGYKRVILTSSVWNVHPLMLLYVSTYCKYVESIRLTYKYIFIQISLRLTFFSCFQVLFDSLLIYFSQGLLLCSFVCKM